MSSTTFCFTCTSTGICANTFVGTSPSGANGSLPYSAPLVGENAEYKCMNVEKEGVCFLKKEIPMSLRGGGG